MWRSLVAYLNGVQGVEGSNPFIPTKNYKGLRRYDRKPFLLHAMFYHPFTIGALSWSLTCAVTGKYFPPCDDSCGQISFPQTEFFRISTFLRCRAILLFRLHRFLQKPFDWIIGRSHQPRDKASSMVNCLSVQRDFGWPHTFGESPLP